MRDAVMLLQPTAPLRSAEDIENCAALLEKTGADSVVSVVDVGGHHPLRMKKMSGDRLVNYVEQKQESMGPRQELPPVYIRNGAIYLSKREVLFKRPTMVGADCRGYIMPAERSVNIDTPFDLILANHLLSKRS